MPDRHQQFPSPMLDCQRELVPQEAQPCTEDDDEVSRTKSSDKLARLVVNCITYQHGHFDTQHQRRQNEHRFRRVHKSDSSYSWWGSLCRQWKEKAIERSAVEWAAQWEMSEEKTARAVALLQEEHFQKSPRSNSVNVRFDSPGGHSIDLASGPDRTVIIDEEWSINWDRLQAEAEQYREDLIRWIPIEEIKQAFLWYVGRLPTGQEFYALVGLWKRNEIELEDFKLRTEKFKDHCPIDYGHQYLISRNSRATPRPAIEGLCDLGLGTQIPSRPWLPPVQQGGADQIPEGWTAIPPGPRGDDGEET